MTASSALGTARLAYWLSPAFPTGSFAYSHGLEYAFEAGWIDGLSSFQDWLLTLVKEGSGWCDAALCSLSWRAENPEELANLSAFGQSLAGSYERHKETTDQGSAFLEAVGHWSKDIPFGKGDTPPLPVCVGACARANAIAHGDTVAVFLNSFLINLTQAAQRMGRFGQSDSVELVANLEALIESTAAKACLASQDDILSSTILADHAAMMHETMEARVFIS